MNQFKRLEYGLFININQWPIFFVAVFFISNEKKTVLKRIPFENDENKE